MSGREVTGTIKVFHKDKGFGFVGLGGNERDLFFHVSRLILPNEPPVSVDDLQVGSSLRGMAVRGERGLELNEIFSFRSAGSGKPLNGVHHDSFKYQPPQPKKPGKPVRREDKKKPKSLIPFHEGVGEVTMMGASGYAIVKLSDGTDVYVPAHVAEKLPVPLGVDDRVRVSYRDRFDGNETYDVVKAIAFA